MYKNKENNFTGLTEEEVRRSREEHGSNKLPDPELKKWWEFALDALKEPITVILIVITIVTLILSILGVEHISGPILTLIVIGLVTGIAVKTNTAIQKSTENLRRKTAIRYCEVIRDGEVKTINADDLVVGDITMVTLGQEIHADGYLIDGKISVSNAVINGEAEECKKTVIQDYVYEKDESTDAYKNQNHLFAGTVVVAGEGLEKVTVVGKDTVNGETLINMQTLEAPKTALDIALGKLANFINKWGTIAAIIAFVTMTVSGIMQAGLAQYFCGNNYNDRTRQRYGYGYRMSGFSKALVSVGVATGTLLKATGTLAKKSFNKAKDYTDSVKANRKEREENIYYTEDAEFEDVSFNQEDMMEILDIPANSLMCATESGVHLAKKITESL